MFDDKVLTPSEIDLVYDFLNQIGRRLRQINSTIDVYYDDIYGSINLEYMSRMSDEQSTLIEYKIFKQDGLYCLHDVDEIDPDIQAAKLGILFKEYERQMCVDIKQEA